jgi:hypothetical protein
MMTKCHDVFSIIIQKDGRILNCCLPLWIAARCLARLMAEQLSPTTPRKISRKLPPWDEAPVRKGTRKNSSFPTQIGMSNLRGAPLPMAGVMGRMMMRKRRTTLKRPWSPKMSPSCLHNQPPRCWERLPSSQVRLGSRPRATRAGSSLLLCWVSVAAPPQKKNPKPRITLCTMTS